MLEEMGRRIKELRIKRSMSQTKLAELAGYKDKSAIAHIEAGRRDISQSKLIAIAEALNTTPSYLMDGDENYYDDPAVQKIAQEIYDNPEYRILFDAARDSKPEDLHMAAEILKKFKETNPDG